MARKKPRKPGRPHGSKRPAKHQRTIDDLWIERAIAIEEHVKRTGRVPTDRQIAEQIKADFREEFDRATGSWKLTYKPGTKRLENLLSELRQREKP